MKVKNWSEFQHYKNRRPPWIKLHHELLDDYEFHRLPAASRALAPMIWLLASEECDGSLLGDIDKIAFRLHQTQSEVLTALKPLISKGFLVWEQGDSALLASCQQSAMPEESREETETETETEAKTSTCSISQPAHAQHMLTQSQSQSQSQESKSITAPDKRKATRIPPNYVVTEEMRAWAKQNHCPSPDVHVAEFLDYWTATQYAKGLKMDWDATFRNWLRNAAKFAPRNGKRLDGWTPPLNMPADYVPESVKRSRELAARKAQGA